MDAATAMESPYSIAYAKALSRTLAMAIALYLGLLYTFGYAILSWSVSNRLASISHQGICGYETAFLIGLLAFLVALPTGLLWLGKIGQGLLAYGIGQFVALAAGIAFHTLLVSRACLI
jgi:hypothetical protein